MIANPGSIPELMHMAEWSSAHNFLAGYAAPLVNTPSSMQMRKWAEQALIRDRYVEWANANHSTNRAAAVKELEFLAFRRLMPGSAMTSRALENRTRAFDRRASKWVREEASGSTAVLLRSSAALDTIRAAKQVGAPVVLDHPIVHHRALAAILAAESEQVPQLAKSMTLDRHGEDVLERMDAELDESDLILALSTAHAASFTEAGISPKKIIVANLGVNTSLFTPRPGTVGRDLKKMLFVGQVNQRKGFSYALDLLDALPSEYTLTAVGPIGNGVREYTEGRGLGERVRLVGPVARAGLQNFYHHAGVFIFPTLAEGFPQTPLEAMACGMPVVASPATYGWDGPLSNQDNSFIVDQRDSEQFAAAVERLASDPELYESFSARSIQTAMLYTWRRFASTLHNEVAKRLSL